MTRTINVLELSDGEGAAAFCGLLFQRSGGRVTRVEAPDRPEPRRAADLYLNTGKGRVALDVLSADGRERLAELVASSHVVVTDLGADAVDALELDSLGGAETVAVVSITPFGRSGPRRNWAATNASLLALSGHTWLAGDPGRAPLTMPWPYADYQAGQFAYVAARACELAGGGQSIRRIEVSTFEVLVGLHQFTDTIWVDSGRVRTRHGNRFDSTLNLLVPCRDGWVELSLPPNFWVQFAHMIGRPDLASDHPLATHAARMERQDEVEALLIDAFADWDADRVLREGQEVFRVPVGYAASLADLLADEQLQRSDFWQALPGRPGVRVPGPAVRINGVRPGSASGSVGAHEAVVAPEPGAPMEAKGHGAASRRRATPRPAAPLEGIRVLDLTRVWAGPLATRMLGDLGAEVTRIEAASARGPTRPAVDSPPGAARPWNRQGLNNKLNRNKRSVVLDLKREQGRAIFLELVARSDVVVENFSARVMPGLGLDYDQLQAVNSRLVYVAMPSYGLEAPKRDYIGFGSSTEPSSGFTALMGYSEAEPRITAAGISDPIAGTTAAAAIVDALLQREVHGRGCFIELAQQQAGLAFLGEAIVEQQLTGREPTRIGNASPLYAPHGVYRSAGGDEWIQLAARDESEWRALALIAGAGWEADVRFASADARLANRRVLDERVERWTSRFDKHALTEQLQAAGVPAAPVQRPPEWIADAHLTARGYFAELEHPEVGRDRWDGSPLLFDGERGYDGWRAAPLLGEHNRAVLVGELGHTEDEVAALERAGVIADRPPE